jgi:hypothetical protein
MLKRRIRNWFLKRLGIRLYACDHQISEFTLQELNSNQVSILTGILKKKIRNELTEKLPIIFVENGNPESKNFKISAYIYALEIRDEKNES